MTSSDEVFRWNNRRKHLAGVPLEGHLRGVGISTKIDYYSTIRVTVSVLRVEIQAPSVVAIESAILVYD